MVRVWVLLFRFAGAREVGAGGGGGDGTCSVCRTAQTAVLLRLLFLSAALASSCLFECQSNGRLNHLWGDSRENIRHWKGIRAPLTIDPISSTLVGTAATFFPLLAITFVG